MFKTTNRKHEEDPFPIISITNNGILFANACKEDFKLWNTITSGRTYCLNHIAVWSTKHLVYPRCSLLSKLNKSLITAASLGKVRWWPLRDEPNTNVQKLENVCLNIKGECVSSLIERYMLYFVLMNESDVSVSSHLGWITWLHDCLASVHSVPTLHCT